MRFWSLQEYLILKRLTSLEERKEREKREKREREKKEREERKRREREKRESFFKIRYPCKLWNLTRRNLEVSLTEISGELGQILV